MIYATQDDLVPQRMTLADLAELTSESDTPDSAVVEAALAEAAAVVDSYCGQRYRTPLQPSGLVKKLTLDLAVFDLASRRRDTRENETWTQRRDQAMSFLRDVASGKASLDQDAATTQPQMSSADVTVPCRPQTFNDDNLRGFC